MRPIAAPHTEPAKKRLRSGTVRGLLLFAAALAASAVAVPRPAPATEIGALDVRVVAGADDAEELANRFLDAASSDLELTTEKVTQTVGIRFQGVGIPAGATITSAWIQFAVDETGSASTDLILRAEDAPNPAPFAGNGNVTSRPVTAAAVAWTPPPWMVIGGAGLEQRTPDLAPLLQSIVDRPDWIPGNAVAVIVTGTGTRTAVSFEGSAAAAPLLHVEWSADTSTTTTLPTTTTTTAATTTTSPTTTSTSSTTTSSTTTSSTTTTLPTTTTTTSPPTGTFETRVTSGGNDVEQITNGWLYTNSSDLELTEDVGTQTVGLRFAGVPIPAGATITTAWVRFTVDETTTAAAALHVHLHDTGNAPPFSGNSGVSNRPATAMIDWVPDSWMVPGTSGDAQRTPDLAPLVQAVVSRPDWIAGNALAVVVTGTGTRTAVAYEAAPAAAALFHVEWSIGSPPTTTTSTTVPPTTTSSTTSSTTTLPTTTTSTTTTTTSTTLPPTTTTSSPPGPSTRIAVIGDYGSGNTREAQVADMIDAAGVDAIVTAGDNVYASTGFDRLVGRYYHEWIGNYSGIYGPGSWRNRFFPSLGNHDYSDVGLPGYLAFFTLPGDGVISTNTSGNERYYDARIDDIHLFIVNSQPQEPDGLHPDTIQGAWLQSALAASSAEWKIVIFHNPPYSSIPGKSAQWMQWPFAAWGADLVVTGDAHVYERLRIAGFDYVITGLGINNSPQEGPLHAGSQVFYSADDAGALFITACPGAMQLQYRALTGGVVDTYTIGAGVCP